MTTNMLTTLIIGYIIVSPLIIIGLIVAVILLRNTIKKLRSQVNEIPYMPRQNIPSYTQQQQNISSSSQHQPQSHQPHATAQQQQQHHVTQQRQAQSRPRVHVEPRNESQHKQQQRRH